MTVSDKSFTVQVVKAKSEPRRNARRLAETASPDPILDINGAPISPEWAGEFRGFFFGEGTLSAYYYNSTETPGIQHAAIQASIGLRSDDAATLQEFQRRLGGKLSLEKYRDGSDRTITRWRCGTAANCYRIALLLGGPRIPFVKSRQVALWKEAVQLKMAKGIAGSGRYAPEERKRLREIHDALLALRKWVAVTT